jgi:hypothetical protein
LKAKLLAIAAALILTKQASRAETPARFDGAELRESVITRLPAECLDITGKITVRRRHGIVIRELGFAVYLDLGGNPPLARYTLFDRLGNALERLAIKRPEGKETSYEYSAGSDLSPAALPDLGRPVQDTDINWIDLTLSFLWWKDWSIRGTETIMGRKCFVVEVPAGDSGADYSRAVLWIDAEMHMLLQAEGYDRAGKIARRIWVRSLKKIGDRWMIKDMEAQGAPAVHRTRIRIEEVTAGAES